MTNILLPVGNITKIDTNYLIQQQTKITIKPSATANKLLI